MWSAMIIETDVECWQATEAVENEVIEIDDDADEPTIKKRKRTGATPLVTRVGNRNRLNDGQRDTRRITNRNSKKTPVPKAVADESIPIQEGSNNRFNFAPSCLGNVLMAVCYSKDPRQWKSFDVNRVLDLCHEQYQRMVQLNNLPRNSFLNEGATDKLNQDRALHINFQRFRMNWDSSASIRLASSAFAE